jgi:hypothetical protein
MDGSHKKPVKSRFFEVSYQSYRVCTEYTYRRDIEAFMLALRIYVIIMVAMVAINKNIVKTLVKSRLFIATILATI